MKATSKPHPSALLSMRGWFLSFRPLTGSKFTNKCACFLEVCKFTTFCDRKGYGGIIGVVGYGRE